MSLKSGLFITLFQCRKLDELDKLYVEFDELDKLNSKLDELDKL